MATTQEIIDYYAGLLIIQYANKPKAYATMQATISNIIMDQLPDQIQLAFDITTAVGVQLDTLGKYAGVSRSVYSFTGPVSLNDADFRTMITVATIKNSFGSSLFDIQDLLNTFFPGVILVFDFRTMRIGYFFDSSIGSLELAEVFVKSGFLPKPMGVQLTSLIYGDNINNFYGFRTYLQPGINNSPFNTYDDYLTDDPWLSYVNSISV